MPGPYWGAFNRAKSRAGAEQRRARWSAGCAMCTRTRCDRRAQMCLSLCAALVIMNCSCERPTFYGASGDGGCEASSLPSSSSSCPPCVHVPLRALAISPFPHGKDFPCATACSRCATTSRKSPHGASVVRVRFLWAGPSRLGWAVGPSLFPPTRSANLKVGNSGEVHPTSRFCVF